MSTSLLSLPKEMPDYPSLSTAIGVSALAILVARYITWRQNVKDLPPGPRKLPFIDNLHNMPNGLDWVRFSEMCKQYNTDILHLGALGNSIVILNTYEAAKELLDRRAGIYSDRPRSTMFDMSGFSSIMTILPYGDRWRISRRMFTTYFGASTGKNDQSREIFYTRRCLVQLLDDPNNFFSHTQHLAASIAISAAYGLRAQPKDDPNIQLSEQIVKRMSGIAEKGLFLVDIFPSLQYLPGWFPGASFKEIARECRDLIHLARNSIYNSAVAEMESPRNQSDSLVSQQLEELGLSGKTHEIELLKDVASTVYLAAADTTWSAMGTFFLAMVVYPEVQKKAQRELDDVLRGKLPEHDDIEFLPYLTAIFLEVLRWKPVFSIGFTHVSMSDDTYEGKRIPKGSLVFPNQWAMLNDPKVYPNPSEFIPERYLKDGKIDTSIRSPFDIAFGFGRRICPGRRMAQSILMMTAASVLSTFDLRMKVDEKGQVIPPTQEHHLSIISHPKEFACDIVPRNTQARQLIENWAIIDGDSPP